MANERLRAAIFASRFDLDGIAHELGVDRKTVERWIAGRMPYKKHRYDLAALLNADPGYIWPAESAEASSDLALAEVVAIYPVRSTVPNQVWIDLFHQAEHEIDMLVYAGFWLSEDPAIRKVLQRKADAGVKVRLLLGDPGCEAVEQRGRDEGIGSAVAAKIGNAIHNYRELRKHAEVDLRLHDTVLYNSIYRADDQMLVNNHLYGMPAHMTPLIHLRRVTGAELFANYADSFERVWCVSKAADSIAQVA